MPEVLLQQHPVPVTLALCCSNHVGFVNQAKAHLHLLNVLHSLHEQCSLIHPVLMGNELPECTEALQHRRTAVWQAPHAAGTICTSTFVQALAKIACSAQHGASSTVPRCCPDCLA